MYIHSFLFSLNSFRLNSGAICREEVGEPLMSGLLVRLRATPAIQLKQYNVPTHTTLGADWQAVKTKSRTRRFSCGGQLRPKPGPHAP